MKDYKRKDYKREVLEALGGDLTSWAKRCHEASLAIVRARVFPQSRVARGTCLGVRSQHSWVVVGTDCYDDKAMIVDPTLWSYDASVLGVWEGTYRDNLHCPHGGEGSIWMWGKPAPARAAPIELTPREPLSVDARRFLIALGPLDAQGWCMLASHAPVGGWPAGEILAAMDDTPELSALVPIDRLGMLTNRNPSGLYLAEE